MASPRPFYHVGWPPDAADVLDRTRRGLPVYWPTDPKDVDQTPYIAFAERDKTPEIQEDTR